MAGRPKKAPKPKVKIKQFMTYIENLPEDDPLKAKLTEDKMIRLRRYLEELEYLDYIILGLKSDIAEHGEIEVYENGAQRTRRTNPALTTLIDTIKTYNQLFRQASEIVSGAEIEIKKEWWEDDPFDHTGQVH